MAETTADVKRDIELTRERMSSTLAQLERKMNLTQIVKDNPWPALGLAVGAGLLLSGTRADVKAAAATVVATKGASGKLGTALDDIVAHLMSGVGEALQGHVDTLVGQVKTAIGAPTGDGSGSTQKAGFASYGGRDAAPSLADTDAHPAAGSATSFAGDAGSNWAPQSSGGTIGRVD